jgi:hypothetical protein
VQEQCVPAFLEVLSDLEVVLFLVGHESVRRPTFAQS